MGERFSIILGQKRSIAAVLAEQRTPTPSCCSASFGEAKITPDQVNAEEAFRFVHGAGPSGKEPAAATIGARLACISSFYRFLIRLGLLVANPCDRLERPRILPPKPRGLGTRQINCLLAAIPSTPAGKRDRAIIITLLLTARRRSEVVGNASGDITPGAVPAYAYRGKGGDKGWRELPRPALAAIEEALQAWGRSLRPMAAADSLLPSGKNADKGLISGAFYSNLQSYFRRAGLQPAGVHVLRHSAAKLRREVGQSIEELSQFLDHSSLAVTTTYLRRLEGIEDPHWPSVATTLGLSFEPGD